MVLQLAVQGEKCLRRSAENIEQFKDNKEFPLFRASYHGNPIEVAEALNAGAEATQVVGGALNSIEVARLKANGLTDVRIKEFEGSLGDEWTALYVAAWQGHKDAVEMLLGAGAYINNQGKKYVGTALLAASYNGHDEVVDFLIERGANVNQVMHRAVPVNHIMYKSSYEFLSDKVCDASPLLAASFRGHTKVAKILLDNGADPERIDSKKYLCISAYYGHEEIVKLFIDSGVSVKSEEMYVPIALIYSAERRHAGILKLLIDEGAGEYYSEILEDLLCKAEKLGHQDIADILLDAGAECTENDVIPQDTPEEEVHEWVYVVGKSVNESMGHEAGDL